MEEKNLNIIDIYKHEDLDYLKKLYIENTKKENSRVLCLNLQNGPNIGCIVRTASLFGFSNIDIIGRRVYDTRPTVGTRHYIPINRISATKGKNNEDYDFEMINSHLENLSKTHTIVFVEQGGTDIKFMNKQIQKHKKPPVFVMGSENKGIPDEILSFPKSLRISIPQKGFCRSFNVSTAFTIVAYEWSKKEDYSLYKNIIGKFNFKTLFMVTISMINMIMFILILKFIYLYLL